MGQDDIVVMRPYDCPCSRRAKGPYVSGGPTADDAVLEELRTVVVKGAPHTNFSNLWTNVEVVGSSRVNRVNG